MTSTFWQLPIWSETLNEAPEPKAVDAQAIERETMEFDVVIVGAGPAGLAAAIRLKQLAAETGNELSVVVLEKGSEVGAHILSGAVIDPVGLDALIPTGATRALRSPPRSARTSSIICGRPAASACRTSSCRR